MNGPLTQALARSVVDLFKRFDAGYDRSELLDMGWRYESGTYYLEITENVTLVLTDGFAEEYPREVVVNDMSLGEIVAAHTFEYMATDYLAIDTDDGTTLLYEIQGASA